MSCSFAALKFTTVCRGMSKISAISEHFAAFLSNRSRQRLRSQGCVILRSESGPLTIIPVRAAISFTRARTTLTAFTPHAYVTKKVAIFILFSTNRHHLHHSKNRFIQRRSNGYIGYCFRVSLSFRALQWSDCI